jgi:hypothetical protein
VGDTARVEDEDTAVICDLAKQAGGAMNPAGEWNHLVISCRYAMISVFLNGRPAAQINLDDFSPPQPSLESGPVVFRDYPRQGFIGLANHDCSCSYKNIKVLSLTLLSLEPNPGW